MQNTVYHLYCVLHVCCHLSCDIAILLLLIIIIPNDQVLGVDDPSIKGAQEIPRVAHHGTTPAAVCAGILVERLAREQLEQFLYHLVELGTIG